MRDQPPHAKFKLGVVIVIALLILVGLFWYFSPTEETQNQSSNDLASNSNQIQANPSESTTENAVLRLSQGLEGTEINCEFKLDGANQLVVNSQIRDCFEYFLTQIGEKDLSLIRQDVVLYLTSTLTEPARAQAIDLWQRYYDFRQQLQHVQAKGSPNDKGSAYYRSIFQSIQSLRQQFFSAPEIDGLFGPEDVYHGYTLDRMDIMANDSLSEAEKAAQLKQRFNELPEDLKENLQQMSQLDDLNRLTAEIKARGGNAADIREMRMNLVGPEATQRLEVLDQQRATWKSQVEQHLTARDQIMKSNLNESAKQQALSDLRQKNFPENHDQLRIQTFEQVHDKGEKLPFPENLD